MRKYQLEINGMIQGDGATLEWEGLSEEVIYMRPELQEAKHMEILGKNT